MIAGPMRLVLSEASESGLTKANGSELLTPDGSKVTGIASVRIDLRPGDLVEVTVVLRQVLIEHPKATGAKP